MLYQNILGHDNIFVYQCILLIDLENTMKLIAKELMIQGTTLF